MAKAQRLERMDHRRTELESEYREFLVAALREAAAGSWGLFDHNQDRSARAKWAATVTELCDRGQEIDRLRADLGLERFALHQQFEASRGPVPSTAPGEPKQARAWLGQLERQG
jgi:hypothetical protein